MIIKGTTTTSITVSVEASAATVFLPFEEPEPAAVEGMGGNAYDGGPRQRGQEGREDLEDDEHDGQEGRKVDQGKEDFSIHRRTPLFRIIEEPRPDA